jgi:hypothetical protein
MREPILFLHNDQDPTRTYVRIIMEQRAPRAHPLRLASQPSPTHIGGHDRRINRCDASCVIEEQFRLTRVFCTYLARTSHFFQTTAFSHHLIEGANGVFH